MHGEGCEPDPLERWFSEGMDVRTNPAVGEQVLAFLKDHAAKSAIVTDGIIGCPHEEGIDYLEGKSCPLCPTGPVETASPKTASIDARDPRCFFSLAAALCFQQVNQERPKVNRQRRKFCKSLIRFWFPYSNQSCCAAPF